VGRGSDVKIEGRVYFPYSLGIFYQALTQYLGFPQYGDEHKVMGIGAVRTFRRDQRHAQEVRLQPDGTLPIFAIIASVLRINGRRSPEFGDLFSPALEQLLGPRRNRHRDIARSVQAMYEEPLSPRR
jgi:carbamoyltransferase